MTKTYLSQSIFTLCVFVLGALLNGNAQVPTISSFTPASAKPGDAVVITGTNFNSTPGNNVVFFGATSATVTAATTTSLTVTVPVGATFAPITLLNSSTTLACASLSKFNPVYSPPKTTIGINDYITRQDFTADSLSFFTAIADFDNDGKSDLAVTNYGANSVSILRNTSSGTTVSFAPKVDFPNVETPNAIAIGDVDADGKPDLIISNVLDTNYTVSILRNTSSIGLISFAAKVDVGVGFYAYGVAIGDIDGDGKIDIATTNHTASSISTIRNTSVGASISFAAPDYFITGSDPNSIFINDMDGDGKADIVVCNSSSSSNSVSVLKNIGSIGSINFDTQLSFAAGVNPTTLAIGDLDNDAKLDFVTANSAINTVSVFKNTSTLGNLSFAAKVDFVTVANPYFVNIADITGDGKPDLAAASTNNNTVSLLRNTSIIGTLSFAAKVDFATGLSPTSLAVGDLNGDSIPEIVSANFGEKSLSVLSAATVILPLKWLSINGTINAQKQVVIRWQVNETNVAKYEIEQSMDRINFSKTGTINSLENGTNQYQFIEPNALTETNYYRIKQIDKNGNFSYSIILKLSTSNVVNTSVYPTLFNNFIIINSSKQQNVTIIDLLGIRRKNITLKIGLNYINTTNLQKGIYFLKTSDGVSMKVVKH